MLQLTDQSYHTRTCVHHVFTDLTLDYQEKTSDMTSERTALTSVANF